MVKKKLDYSKMHLISQSMYEKLKKCLSEDTKKPQMQEEFKETKEPTPGPSNINPATGEYWEDQQPPQQTFDYEESIHQPMNEEEENQQMQQDSLIESFVDDEGKYHKLKRGKKTNDPTKIKSSKKPGIIQKRTQSILKPLIRSRLNLIVRKPQRQRLPTISEENADTYTQPLNQDYYIPEIDVDDPPRPLRTSTPMLPQLEYKRDQISTQPQNYPVVSSVPRVVIPRTETASNRQDFQFEDEYFDDNIHQQRLMPPPQPPSQIKTRRQIRQIPLKSCGKRTVVKFSDGESEILNIPNLGKFKCDLCNSFFTTKYSLKRHKLKKHKNEPEKEELQSNDSSQSSPPSSPQPSTSQLTTQFSQWVPGGKRTASESNQKEHQPRKYKTNPAFTKKRFDTWNL